MYRKTSFLPNHNSVPSLPYNGNPFDQMATAMTTNYIKVPFLVQDEKGVGTLDDVVATKLKDYAHMKILLFLSER